MSNEHLFIFLLIRTGIAINVDLFVIENDSCVDMSVEKKQYMVSMVIYRSEANC